MIHNHEVPSSILGPATNEGHKGVKPLCALLVYIQLDTPSVVVSAVSTVTMT